MPNLKSSKKRVLINQKKAARNKSNRTELKTTLKKFDAAVSSGDRAAADTAYKAAVKTVDQAAAKGLIHKKNAAHKKSQLTLKLNAMETETAVAPNA